MDYEKILRIAERLEKALDNDDSFPKEIDDRTRKEQEDNPPADQCFEAKDESDAADGKEVCASRKRKLARMLGMVKASSMSPLKKREMVARICRAAKNEGIADGNEKIAKSISVNRSDLNKQNVSTEMTKIMKQTGKLNEIVKETHKKGMSLKEMIEEMKDWGKENDVRVNFPDNLLNKTIGSCDADWIIKLGPMVASLIKKYEMLKEEQIELQNSADAAEDQQN